MNNKYLVKRGLLIILIIAFAICSFGCSSKSEKLAYDDKLVQKGEEALKSFPLVEGRSYDVTFDGKVYTVSINGDIQRVQNLNEKKHTSLKELTEVTNRKTLSIVQDSKKLIIDYIDSSDILADKENLKSRVESIPVMYGESEGAAEYRDGKVYINPTYEKAVCEWMIVHELVHFLCELTQGPIDEQIFGYTQFNEGMTDLITKMMNPKIPSGCRSAYEDYYGALLPYIGAFGKEAIRAYFYGYDEIFGMVGKEEFSLYVLSINQVNRSELAVVIINNSINKWGLMEA